MPDARNEGCSVHNIAADCRISQLKLGMRVLFTHVHIKTGLDCRRMQCRHRVLRPQCPPCPACLTIWHGGRHSALATWHTCAQGCIGVDGESCAHGQPNVANVPAQHPVARRSGGRPLQAACQVHTQISWGLTG